MLEAFDTAYAGIRHLQSLTLEPNDDRRQQAEDLLSTLFDQAAGRPRSPL
ncbi:MAG: hypothetical protein R2715_03525 [Ilumatobacteraceae bacterium]